MTKNRILLGASAWLLALAACAEQPKEAPAKAEATAAAAPSAEPTAATQVAATAAAPSAEPSAEPSAAPSAAASAAPTAAADKPAAAAASAEPATGPKTFDCGAKGQKPCPMQGWMKGVMGSAASSGDGDKLASALSYVAARPPPGMGTWSSIAKAGAAKAKAGDIDGAKQSCKQCHDLYKATYKSSMRDRPF